MRIPEHGWTKERVFSSMADSDETPNAPPAARREKLFVRHLNDRYRYRGA